MVELTSTFFVCLFLVALLGHFILVLPSPYNFFSVCILSASLPFCGCLVTFKLRSGVLCESELCVSKMLFICCGQAVDSFWSTERDRFHQPHGSVTRILKESLMSWYDHSYFTYI